ncbi:MAG: hypothetical protein JOZ65_12380 [Chloroflexi bacterium]|nr:hypothetical protein [Chloroflexota bacterium]
MITQSAVTIVTVVPSENESRLQQLLESAGEDPAGNAILPFAQFPNVHFARFFILPASADRNGRSFSSRLVFLADVDGAADAFVRQLVAAAGDGLHAIYQHCAEYPGRSGLLHYLQHNSVPAAATYVNTVGRTVQQVHQEAQLHDGIEAFLDDHAAELSDVPPRIVRTRIQEFVEREPSLHWALQPPPSPDVTYVLGEKLQLAIVGAAGILLFPAILAVAPLYLALLRWHETHDVAMDVVPDDALVQKLAAQEDHGVQNPFTSAGFLKPGVFRKLTGSVVLWGTNFVARHLFNHANLIGVKTIHFARWVFLDNKRRLFFASNYDGSLENYMDDFIDKIAWGLNIVFSNGEDYPETRFLVLDGAHTEQVFKRFNLTHQLVTPFWYAAYQGITALNIENNARIRAGLYGAMDDQATCAWLRRL